MIERLFAALLLSAIVAGPAAGDEASGPSGPGPFQSFHCLRFAATEPLPLELLARGAGDEKAELPFVVCVVRRPGEVILLDAGYVDAPYGATWGARDWVDLDEVLAEVDVAPADVSLVTLSHLHWDHAGGTGRFPNARFVLQKRELSFAAADMPYDDAIRYGFRKEEVLDAVELLWDKRLDLVDGDVEGFRPGLDLYLTPGHTAGTMTVCAATVKGRVCYSSDAVYTFRNLDENLPLGIAIFPIQNFESYRKIRGLLRGGRLVPGHEARLFSEPERFGMRRVSDRVLAIVD